MLGGMREDEEEVLSYPQKVINYQLNTWVWVNLLLVLGLISTSRQCKMGILTKLRVGMVGLRRNSFSRKM
jgi:hypothetical protein